MSCDGCDGGPIYKLTLLSQGTHKYELDTSQEGKKCDDYDFFLLLGPKVNLS